eukprot:scaffold302007_cov38-Prasinocladus_malaysianus.AAC.1
MMKKSDSISALMKLWKAVSGGWGLCEPTDLVRPAGPVEADGESLLPPAGPNPLGRPSHLAGHQPDGHQPDAPAGLLAAGLGVACDHLLPGS